MARKLFLHVGKHKTGSSSIQWYLTNNEQFFADIGLKVVRNTHFANWALENLNDTNCFAFSHTIIRPELMTPIRLRGILPVPNFEDQCKTAVRTNADLHRLSGTALLMSGEAFSFLRTPKERKVFNLMFDGFDLHPILLFREKQSWLHSWKQQTARLRQNFPDADMTSGSIFNYSDNSWLVDDQAIQRFFGPKTRVLSYEGEITKYESVIPAFLRELGIPLKDAPDWDNVWVNRTIQAKSDPPA